MDEARKLATGLVCLLATCLVAIAVLWSGGFTSHQRMVFKHEGEARPHRDPIKVLLRGILL